MKANLYKLFTQPVTIIALLFLLTPAVFAYSYEQVQQCTQSCVSSCEDKGYTTQQQLTPCITNCVCQCVPDAPACIAQEQLEYTITVSPRSQEITQGGTAVFDVQVNWIKGQPERVELQPSGTTDASYRFSPDSGGTGSFTSQLVILTSCDTPPSPVYSFQVTASSTAHPYSQFDVATLAVDANPECAGKREAAPGEPQTKGTVAQLNEFGNQGLQTGEDGEADVALGTQGSVHIDSDSKVSFAKGIVMLQQGSASFKWEPAIASEELPPKILIADEYLAKIKGTEFTTQAQPEGSSKLTVTKGTVEVSRVGNPNDKATVLAGETLVMNTGTLLGGGTDTSTGIGFIALIILAVIVSGITLRWAANKKKKNEEAAKEKAKK
ncbi:MAG TPA: hypothetical protein VGQ00_01730 [Candidatus Norongarragalinales archaeon]|jgi:hypothetical protein|nr:hypothetical protein [Candidatus Norongarragalinales archaeon]